MPGKVQGAERQAVFRIAGADRRQRSFLRGKPEDSGVDVCGVAPCACDARESSRIAQIGVGAQTPRQIVVGSAAASRQFRCNEGGRRRDMCARAQRKQQRGEALCWKGAKHSGLQQRSAPVADE